MIKASLVSDNTSIAMENFIYEVAQLSPRISAEIANLIRTRNFAISRLGEDLGVVFAEIPLGHEFTSLILPLLHVSG